MDIEAEKQRPILLPLEGSPAVFASFVALLELYFPKPAEAASGTRHVEGLLEYSVGLISCITSIGFEPGVVTVS